MTRANIVVVTPQGRFKFQSNSSAYPSNVMACLIRFATSTASNNVTSRFYEEPDSRALSTFINDFGLSLGHVGNPSYFYEVDFVKQTVRVWNQRFRWVKAPADWKEKGWNCWEESATSGFGWTNWVKGKLIYNKTLNELVERVVDFEAILHENVIHEAENIQG